MFDYWQKRSIGRNLGGIVLLAASWFVAGNLLWMIAGAVGLGGEYAREVTWAALILVTVLTVRFFDRMPAAFVGLDRRAWGREILSGSLLGSGMALLSWSIVAAIALVDGDGPVFEGGFQKEALVWFAILLIDAAGEEFLFRGYVFGRVVEMIGPVAAAILSSLGFALAHISNPSVSTIGLINIFLGGLFFSLCYLRSGSLWTVIGAHAFWNIVLAKIAGLPVSGIEFGSSVLRTPAPGPEWLTGGSFGPEGGIAASISLVLGGLYLATSSRFQPSPYAYATLFRAFVRDQQANQTAGGMSESQSFDT